MSKVLINESTLTNIGNAIRNKLDEETLYKPADMPAAIENISGGEDITEYLNTTIEGNEEYTAPIFLQILKKTPTLTIAEGVQSLNYAFSECSRLESVGPILGAENVKNFYCMFESCPNLVTVSQIDTSSGTNFGNMFNDCSRLTTVPQLNMSNATNVENMFEYCESLENLGGFLNYGQTCTSSSDFGSYNLYLDASTELTHESLMNVINGLYDITINNCNTQGIYFLPECVERLTAEEIAIATNKGWSLWQGGASDS